MPRVTCFSQIIAILTLCLCLPSPLPGEETPPFDHVPENLYRGDLVSFPGPWSFKLPRAHIILVSDQELEALSDPDTKLNMSLGHSERMESLREICERGQASGTRTLVLAFDHFFRQYRPGQDEPRRLTPDMDEYIERITAIGRFAGEHGMGLELSLLSPLEIGPAYTAKTGESGKWMHYRKGLRDPKTGAYSVQLWQHKRWVNNKGPIPIHDAGVRVFAFREAPLANTPYRFVDPEQIIEITDTARVETYEGMSVKRGDFVAERIRIHGSGRADLGPLDRVMVIQQYRTPEMDYFSAKAYPFLTSLIDRYADAGIKLNALYSDEMHIQQDWVYHSHHDNGELAMRYVSDGLAATFADRYGEEYRDFAKYLVYFIHGQEDSSFSLDAKLGVMHVFGRTPQAIRETALFRSRYYRLLQNGVVDLFVRAKRHAEKRMGHRLLSRAHATWAQSPTIDRWDVGRQNHHQNKYEYTSNFVWSNTVHQSAAACSDYFAWGDYLTGTGNDHTEGGWLDRDYYALALGCSTGILNEIPYSYAAHWGMPRELSRRRMALVNAYGASSTPSHGIVQGVQHRDVDVLMLYPLDLVSVEERFGSWMTQYGYTNYVTQEKLLERASVKDGAITMAGRTFHTLVAPFEPFPDRKLLDLMHELAEGGGRVIWSGPPPVLFRDGTRALEPWKKIFSVDYRPDYEEGQYAPGRVVHFEGPLAGVNPQTILTHFLVDRIYPVTPQQDAVPVARVQGQVVGTVRDFDGGGTATFLGYRPRDDQSGSLGYDVKNWFEILSALGAYPATGRFEHLNDNTENLSRTTPFLSCRFPNGAVSVAPHLYDLLEDWDGGFSRNEERDKAYLERVPPPPEDIHLQDFHVNGHRVTYDGRSAVTFRVDRDGNLIGFAGNGCDGITVDGKTTVFAEREFNEIAWAPVPESRRVEDGAIFQLLVRGNGTVRIPAVGLPDEFRLFAQGAKPGSRGEEIECTLEDGSLVFEANRKSAHRWLYVVPSNGQ